MNDLLSKFEQMPGWEIASDQKSVSKQFIFKDFVGALAFANQIGEVAEQEGHHPDLLVAWGKVGVTLTTHDVDGLSEKDFLLATKIDALTQK